MEFNGAKESQNNNHMNDIWLFLSDSDSHIRTII